MEKFLWVRVGRSEEIARRAVENNVDAIVVAREFSGMVTNMGRAKLVGRTFGDLRFGREVASMRIASGDDIDKAIKLSQRFEYLIVVCKDWKVIPLENLIAQSSAKIIAEVQNSKEAEIAINILERGVDGVLLYTKNPDEIRKTKEILERRNLEKIDLVEAEITQIVPTRSGDRACIDTTILMREGEGLLVGNHGNSFFLVQAECIENPFIEPRPFRINAGAVHSYTRVPEGKTKYLSELKSNDDILIVNAEGEGKIVTIGRVKIERRPMVFVKAVFQSQEASIILQNAETIRLISGNKKPISIAQLKEGDKVLCHFSGDKGRHFGVKVEESIIEQ